MKTILFIIISLIIVIFFFGCSINLKISNESSYALWWIYWVNESGEEFYFYKDLVYGEYWAGMYPGSSLEKIVGTGNCPVFFCFPGEYLHWHTVEPVVVKQWQTTVFVFTDYTLIERSGKTATELKEAAPTINKTSP